MAVAKILAKLGLNITEWTTNLTKAQQQVNTFASANLAQFKNAVAGAFTVGAIVAWTKHAADAAEQTINVSKALGISTTAFQALSAAAKLSGQSQEDVISMLQKLRKAMGAAAEGSDSMRANFANLGISLEGIGSADPAAVLEKIAKASQGAAEDSQKFNDIIQILGRDSLPKMQAVLDEIASGGLTELEKKYRAVINTAQELAALAQAKQQMEFGGQAVGKAATGILGGLIGSIRFLGARFAAKSKEDEQAFADDIFKYETTKATPKEVLEERRRQKQVGRGGGGAGGRTPLSEEIIKQVEKANAESRSQDSSSSYQMGQSAADVARQEEMEKHRKSAKGYLAMMQNEDDPMGRLSIPTNARARIGGFVGSNPMLNEAKHVVRLMDHVKKLLQQMVTNSQQGAFKDT